MKTRENVTSKYYRTGIILLTFIFLIPWINITAQDFTKDYSGKYDVDKGATLLIKNKFGDVKCVAWDENSVSINVTVKVDASSQEKANRVFDKISVELSGDRNLVKGTTTISNISNAEYSVNYDIRMPRWINIDLNNQFGDIYVDEIDGTAKIDLEYGSMNANAFNGANSDLTVKFSDVEIGFMKDGTLDIEYSKLKLKGVENLKLISRFNEINLGKLSSLNLDSQYDEVDVENAGEVISVSRFTELDFGKINGDFDFDIEYGDLDVDYISAAFKTGKVRNSFAGVDLTFDSKATMNIDAELEFGELSYPKAGSMNHETEGYTTNIYKGKLGSAAGMASQLTIHSKNADVTIDFSE
jgi:hypothetical protein